MADGDDPTSAPPARGPGGRSGARPQPPSNDPRVDGPTGQRRPGRNANRNRARNRGGADTTGGIPLPGPLTGGASLPPPTLPGAAPGPAADATLRPEPPTVVGAVDWTSEPASEHSTGEVAMTTLARPDVQERQDDRGHDADEHDTRRDLGDADRTDPAARPSGRSTGDAAPAASGRAGRSRHRPSGRVPVVKPAGGPSDAGPVLPPIVSALETAADRPLDRRGAADVVTGSETSGDADVYDQGVDPSSPLVRLDGASLPPAEMLATLVEPEPPVVVEAPVAAPEPEPEPAAPILTPIERITRSIPAILRPKPRRRVRRVTRVLRHIDTWSVFKVALVFNTVLYVVCLTAGVLLWNVAYTTGTIDNVENFFEQFGWSSFEFKGGEIYHQAWIAGLFAAIGLTGFAVLLATLFNLITDLVGGVRMSVLEEEVVARQSGDTTIIRRPPKRERTDRALSNLERFERETAARHPSGTRSGRGGSFVRRADPGTPVRAGDAGSDDPMVP